MEEREFPRVIGIIGQARHGKNIASEYFIENHGYTLMSFAEPLKKLGEALIQGVDNLEFVRLARELHVNTKDAIQIDSDLLKLRQIIKHMNLTPDMDPEDKKKRHLWQQMGTEIFREYDEDCWVNSMNARSVDLDRMVISDVRFPNEIAWIRYHCGIIYKVERLDGFSIESSHASEHAWRTAKPDYTVQWMDGFKELPGQRVPPAAIDQLKSRIKDSIETWPAVLTN
jgi:hypothetical protein